MPAIQNHDICPSAPIMSAACCARRRSNGPFRDRAAGRTMPRSIPSKTGQFAVPSGCRRMSACRSSTMASSARLVLGALRRAPACRVSRSGRRASGSATIRVESDSRRRLRRHRCGAPPLAADEVAFLTPLTSRIVKVTPPAPSTCIFYAGKAASPDPASIRSRRLLRRAGGDLSRRIADIARRRPLRPVRRGGARHAVRPDGARVVRSDGFDPQRLVTLCRALNSAMERPHPARLRGPYVSRQLQGAATCRAAATTTWPSNLFQRAPRSATSCWNTTRPAPARFQAAPPRAARQGVVLRPRRLKVPARARSICCGGASTGRHAPSTSTASASARNAASPARRPETDERGRHARQTRAAWKLQISSGADAPRSREKRHADHEKRQKFASITRRWAPEFPLLVIPGGLNLTIAVSIPPILQCHEGVRQGRFPLHRRRPAQCKCPASRPVSPNRSARGTHTDDHIGLMDHLGIDKFMVLGYHRPAAHLEPDQARAEPRGRRPC